MAFESQLARSNGYAGLVDGSGNPLAQGGGGWPRQEDPFRPRMGVDGMAIPLSLTYAGMMGSQRGYWRDLYDEALRHAREDARAMEFDTGLMGPLQERMLATVSLPWHLHVPDEQDPVQLAVKDHLTKTIENMVGPEESLLKMRMNLLWAIWFGRQGAQVKWRWCRQNTIRTLTMAEWGPVRGDKISHLRTGTPCVDVYGGAGDYEFPDSDITPTTSGARALVLHGDMTWGWRTRMLIHRHEQIDRDYFETDAAEAALGSGVRSRVFWLDWISREWLSRTCDWIDRVGLGVNVWYYDASNAAAKTQAEFAAKNQTNRTNILVPRWGGDKFPALERMEVPTGGAQLLLQLRQDIREQQKLYIIGQTMSTGGDSGRGDLGGSHRALLAADTKEQIRNFDSRNLDSVMTGSMQHPGLVSMLQYHTFPSTWPSETNPDGFRVSWVSDLEDKESMERLNAGTALISVGVPIKTDELRSAGGFSKPAQGDEVIGGPQMGMGQPGMEGMPGGPGGGGAPPAGAPPGAGGAPPALGGGTPPPGMPFAGAGGPAAALGGPEAMGGMAGGEAPPEAGLGVPGGGVGSPPGAAPSGTAAPPPVPPGELPPGSPEPHEEEFEGDEDEPALIPHPDHPGVLLNPETGEVVAGDEAPVEEDEMEAPAAYQRWEVYAGPEQWEPTPWPKPSKPPTPGGGLTGVGPPGPTAAPPAAPRLPTPKPAFKPAFGYEHVGHTATAHEYTPLGHPDTLEHARTAARAMAGALALQRRQVPLGNAINYSGYPVRLFLADTDSGNVTRHGLNPAGRSYAQLLDEHQKAAADNRVFGRFHINPQVRGFLAAIDEAHRDAVHAYPATDPRGWQQAAYHADQAPALIFADWLAEHGHANLEQWMRDRMANWGDLPSVGSSPTQEEAEATAQSLRQKESDPERRYRVAPGAAGHGRWVVQHMHPNERGPTPTVEDILTHLATHAPEPGTYRREDEMVFYFDPNEPRDPGGQWTAGPGSSAPAPPETTDEPQRPETPHTPPGDADPEKNLEAWSARSSSLPGRLLNRVQDAAIGIFRRFERRYGRKAAWAMTAAAAALLPVPIPGVSLLGPIGVAEGIKAVRRLFAGGESYARDEDGVDIDALAREFVDELTRLVESEHG